MPGAFKLDHLQPIKPLLFPNFSIFSTFILGGQFKLDHLQPIKPFLFPNFSIFFTFILGGQFLLPQRANIGKRAISQLKNWTRQRVSSAWAFKLGHMHPFKTLLYWNISIFFTFILGGQFLLPQRANNGKGEFSQLQN